MLPDGGLRNRGSILYRRQSSFLSISRSALGNSQPCIQWVSSCHGPLSEGLEADHTTLANAQAKNEWSYASTHITSWQA
jgi:hypothetical protein